MKDFMSREIEVGSVIAFPRLSGRSAFIAIGKVVAIKQWSENSIIYKGDYLELDAVEHDGRGDWKWSDGKPYKTRVTYADRTMVLDLDWDAFLKERGFE